jgi:hypothetical protein
LLLTVSKRFDDVPVVRRPSVQGYDTLSSKGRVKEFLSLLELFLPTQRLHIATFSFLIKRAIQGVTVMHTINIVRQKSFPLIVSLVIAVAFLFTACGTNAGTGTGSTGNVPSTPAPTVVQGHGTSNGCPSDAVVSTAPSKPDVTVKPTDHSSTINAHVGNVIEFDLPFGLAWAGPSTSLGVLELQTPAGYAWPANKVCVWRFTAQSTGTTQVNFSARPMCKKGLFCPQYMLDAPFTISVK